MNIPDDLQPGDCLLYKAKGIFGWLISIKTWHAVSHCEVYVGSGLSVASRDGIGVNRYPVRLEGLITVLRPKEPFQIAQAMRWFWGVQGQKYDWLGLLRFAWRSKVVPDNLDNRMFCSEFATRFYRAGGLDPFNGGDADAIAPFQFRLSPVFDVTELS